MYANQDLTPEQLEEIRVVTSDEYQLGLEMGYRLALRNHGITEEENDNIHQ